MELSAQTRTIFGKHVKRLRREGFIPAEIYGRGATNRHISVPLKTFSRVYKDAGENTMVTLVVDDAHRVPVLIADVSRHPITQTFLAIDFREVKQDEKVEVAVPLRFIGEAPAVKNGLFVMTTLSEVEVEALPHHLPRQYEISLVPFETAGQSFAVKDLPELTGVRILTPIHTIIVTVVEKMKEETPIASPVSPETPATVVETSSAPLEPQAQK